MEAKIRIIRIIVVTLFTVVRDATSGDAGESTLDAFQRRDFGQFRLILHPVSGHLRVWGVLAERSVAAKRTRST